PDGKMISASILTHPFKMVSGITKSQILQELPDHITLKLVTDERFNKDEENALLENFRYRVGDNVKIEIEIVTDIPRTKSGKYRWVISKVPKGQLNKNLE
ncbi:hypothetical protein MNBD_GAMMA12-3555, partial [hydrothermal vent metagenome]